MDPEPRTAVAAAKGAGTGKILVFCPVVAWINSGILEDYLQKVVAGKQREVTCITF